MLDYTFYIYIFFNITVSIKDKNFITFGITFGVFYAISTCPFPLIIGVSFLS